MVKYLNTFIIVIDEGIQCRNERLNTHIKKLLTAVFKIQLQRYF